MSKADEIRQYIDEQLKQSSDLLLSTVVARFANDLKSYVKARIRVVSAIKAKKSEFELEKRDGRIYIRRK